MNFSFINRSLKFLLKVAIILSFTTNVIIFIILFTPLTEYLHRLVLVNKSPTKGDVIIICSSNFPFDTPQGLPGLSTLVRMEKGIRLYRDGYADTIIAFGGIRIPRSNKTTGQAIAERLRLYGIPESAIIVQDRIQGKLHYYENLLDMMERFQDKFDFNKAIFVTSADQSYRLHRCLRSEIKNPVVVTGEHYEFTDDWGRRFHIFRRVANELLFGIPYFYFSGRFSVPSTFKWDREKMLRSPGDHRELYETLFK